MKMAEFKEELIVSFWGRENNYLFISSE